MQEVEMRTTLKRRPSPAMIVALIALFVSLGGTVYAAHKISGKTIKRGSEPGNRLKKNSVTGKQVNESTLGQVREAKSADVAAALDAPEGFHEVGAVGEPAFQHGCHNIGANNETVGFYKDHEQVVHLKGVYVGCAGGDTAFQLPPGYRPAGGKQLSFPESQAAATGVVSVLGSGFGSDTDGSVISNAAVGGFLDGITFRAAS
jgi:hypothetical protein